MQTELSLIWPGLRISSRRDASTFTPPAWLLPVLELVVVIGSVELLLFPLREQSLKFLIPVPLVLLLCVAWRSARRTAWTVRDGLIDVATGRRAWLGTGLVSLAGAIAFLALVQWLGLLPNGDSKVFNRGLLHWLGRKIPTVAIQQFGLQLFVLPVCLELFRRRSAAVMVAASIFALIHLPNLPVMGLTFVAGAVCCSLFLWHGRIAPLIVAHLALAVLASETAGHSLHHMRVGTGCLELLPYSVSADGGDLTIVPEAVVGHVDSCRTVDDVVVCHGWALDRRRRDAVRRLVVLIDRKVHCFDLSGHRLPRESVSQMYGVRQNDLVGFAVPVPATLFSEAGSIQFFSEGSDGVLSRLSAPSNLRATVAGLQLD